VASELTKNERAAIAADKIRGAEEAASELIAQKAREVRATFLETFPVLDNPRYYGAIDQYLKALRTDEQIREAIDEMIAAKGAASVKPAMWEAHAKWARAVQQAQAALGLDPQSEAKLALIQGAAFNEANKAADLSKLAEEGARLRKQRAGDEDGDVIDV
jgi:hypothetical protein